MAKLKLDDVRAGAKLLKTMTAKVDVGPKDGVLKPREVGPVAANEPLLLKAMLAHVTFATNKGDSSLKGVKAAIDASLKAVLALDKDGSGVLEDAELKHSKTKSAQALIDFAAKDAKKSAKDFDLGMPEAFRPPTRPFFPSGSAAQIATRATKYYNSRANDDYWPGPYTSMYVVGKDEAKALTGAIATWRAPLAKAVVRAINDSVHSGDVPRIWLDPSAARAFTALAKKLGVTGLDFSTPHRAPKFPGY